MKEYLQSHIENFYLPNPMLLSGLKKYANSSGWEDFYIGNHLLFSHRKTYYNTGMFPEKLHSHAFFEMDIYMEGSISYISGTQEMLPHKNDIMMFPPGCQHTARLLEPGCYERYVFYFSPQFFTSMGMTDLPAFFSETHACFHHIRPDAYPAFCYLIEHLKHTLIQLEQNTTLNTFSDVLQLFHLIATSSEPNSARIMDIPANVRELRDYVDQNFKTLQTVNDIAQHFYYSREYVSKIFRQYYNLPLSEYMMIQKINCAKALLTEALGKAWNCGRYKNLVFTMLDGSHYTQSWVYKMFQRVLKSAGLGHYRVHDLRHTYVVDALRAGDDVKTVQASAGHYSAAFTLDRYAHVTASMQRESAARMQSFLDSL